MGRETFYAVGRRAPPTGEFCLTPGFQKRRGETAVEVSSLFSVELAFRGAGFPTE
jgi:hypothetical protein